MVSKKFLFTGFIVLSIIVLGTMFVYAQDSPNTTGEFSDLEEVTLSGIISSVDDRGLIILSGEDSYYIVLPYSFDRSAINLNVGTEITVTGYIVDFPMYGLAIHATNINGIVIDHVQQQQQQLRTDECDGTGDGSGSMNKNGSILGGKKA